MNREVFNIKIQASLGNVVSRCVTNGGVGVSLLELSANEGESPSFCPRPDVYGTHYQSHVPRDWSVKWVVMFIQNKIWNLRPIVNKYHEGMVKRTLKRELKVLDIVKMKANGIFTRGTIVVALLRYLR